MSNEVFNEGPTTSQHVESLDEDHFQNTTFKLKRTRSMGLLLDNGVVPFSSSPTLNPTTPPEDISLAVPVSVSHLPSPTSPAAPNSKLADGSFIPKEALNKLNLKTPKTTSSSNNLFRTNIINKKSPNNPSSPNALSYGNQRYYNRSHQYVPNTSSSAQHAAIPSNVINSPQSFQSVDYSCSDDIYNSEDSASSTSPNSSVHNSSICLIPKHQLKKMNHAAHVTAGSGLGASSLSAGTTSASLSNANSDLCFDNLTSEHEQHQDLTNLLHDDIDVKDCPEQHVDYLTHKWDEEEISKSWKYVTLRRGNVADSARLENASWRTWAQTRLNLKTISPEELNWSKDSDVTWLYGPVIKPSNAELSGRSNSLTDNLDNEINSNTEGMDILMTNSTLIAKDSQDGSAPRKNVSLTVPCLLTATESAAVPSSALSSTSGANPSHDEPLNNDSDTCDHLKSILKKKSNVEKMISDASYSRLQHLLENREKLKFNSTEYPISSVSSNSTITNQNSNKSLDSANPHSNKKTGNIDNSPIANSDTQKRYHRGLKTHSPITSTIGSDSNSASTSTSTLNASSNNLASKFIKSSLKNSSLHMEQQRNNNVGTDVSTLGNKSSAKSSTVPAKKHIHFNMRVDQCIALTLNKVSSDDNYIDSSDESDHYFSSKMASSPFGVEHGHQIDSEMEMSVSDSDDSDDNMDSDSEDEGFVLNPIHHQKMQTSSTVESRLINHQPLQHANTCEEIITIAPLPSTTIKFGSDDELEYEQMKRSKYTVSHNTKTNRGYDYYYDYNTVYSDSLNPLVYNSNVASNVNSEVQMFDVPENCQIDPESDHDSVSVTSPAVLPGSSVSSTPAPPYLNSFANRSLSNNSSVNVSPLILPTSASELVDVPASFIHDIPSLGILPPQHQNTTPNSGTSLLSISSSSSSSSPSDGELEIGVLKRTSSVGSRNASTQSLSSIKIGLSGLDLTATGLKRSTGAGSKPQLFQLANSTPLHPVKHINPPVALSQAPTMKSNKFMFEDFDSDSDTEMQDVDDIDSLNAASKSQLINAVKSSNSFASMGSLSDINRQFGRSSQQLSSMHNKPKPSAFSFGDGSDSESD